MSLQKTFKNINENLLIGIVYSLMHDKKNAKLFNKEFAAFMPDIENEILTFSIDQNCTCKEKIKAYILVYKQEVIDFLIKFSEKNSLIEQVISIHDKLKDDYEKESVEIATDDFIAQPSIVGKVARTTVKDWKEFAEEIKQLKLHYNSFSVVKEGDDLLVFFL